MIIESQAAELIRSMTGKVTFETVNEMINACFVEKVNGIVVLARI